MSNDHQPSTFRKALKAGIELLKKGLCVLDDIPFLLQMKELGNLGSYLLVGAGFVIFPVMFGTAIQDIRKANRKFQERMEQANREEIEAVEALAKTKRNAKYLVSAGKIALSVIGLGASAALLAFVLVNLPILAAAASITIPSIMAVVSGIELFHNIHSLHQAKQSLKHAQASNDPDAVTNAMAAVQKANRKTAYSSAYMGFGLAIAALATVSVLSGLGVLSLGIIPSAVLVGVVAVALAVKIFELVDEHKGFAMSNAIKKGINNVFGTHLKLSFSVRPLVEHRAEPSQRDSAYISGQLARGQGVRASTTIVAQPLSGDKNIEPATENIATPPEHILDDITDYSKPRPAFSYGFGGCVIQ